MTNLYQELKVHHFAPLKELLQMSVLCNRQKFIYYKLDKVDIALHSTNAIIIYMIYNVVQNTVL